MTPWQLLVTSSLIPLSFFVVVFTSSSTFRASRRTAHCPRRAASSLPPPPLPPRLFLLPQPSFSPPPHQHVYSADWLSRPRYCAAARFVFFLSCTLISPSAAALIAGAVASPSATSLFFFFEYLAPSCLLYLHARRVAEDGAAPSRRRALAARATPSSPTSPSFVWHGVTHTHTRAFATVHVSAVNSGEGSGGERRVAVVAAASAVARGHVSCKRTTATNKQKTNGGVARSCLWPTAVQRPLSYPSFHMCFSLSTATWRPPRGAVEPVVHVWCRCCSSLEWTVSHLPRHPCTSHSTREGGQSHDGTDVALSFFSVLFSLFVFATQAPPVVVALPRPALPCPSRLGSTPPSLFPGTPLPHTLTAPPPPPSRSLDRMPTRNTCAREQRCSCVDVQV